VNLRTFERIMGLSMGYLDDPKKLELSETIALLKIVNSMPWIIEVIENNFDPEIAELILHREAINIDIKNRQEALNSKD
jgi:hypothetical protein